MLPAISPCNRAAPPVARAPTGTGLQFLIDRVQAQTRIAPHRHLGRIVVRELIGIDVDAYHPAADRQFQGEVNIGLTHFGAHGQYHVGIRDQGLSFPVGKRGAELAG